MSFLKFYFTNWTNIFITLFFCVVWPIAIIENNWIVGGIVGAMFIVNFAMTIKKWKQS